MKSEHLMNTLLDTLSMCENCYRHIPATRFKKDNQIWLGKTCPEHGYHECLVETDAEFYLNFKYERRLPNTFWFEITNRCNLDCPHCYQMPDNLSIDPTVASIIKQTKELPGDMALALVGAEPTTRKDLPDIVKEIQSLTEVPRWLMVVTNGINLGKRAYAEKFVGIEGLTWTIGLNHPDYNGGVIRKKQQVGIDNCIELGLTIKNFTYTLGSMEQLDDVLEEIQEWHRKEVCSDARIQLGVEIGRTPDEDEPEHYLSELVKTAEQVCKEKGWSWEVDEKNGNRTHYLVRINGITHRFIKWVDVKTIDFEEIYSESWATVVPGKPKSPLLHQVILRDRAVNERKPLFDTLPEKYR